MSKQDIISIIQESFLDDKEKKILITFFEEKGETKEFYKMFNNVVSVAVEKKGNDMITFIKSFKELYDGNESEVENMRLKLKKQLDQELENIDISDVTIRGKAWKKYYQNILDFQNKSIRELAKKYKALKNQYI